MLSARFEPKTTTNIAIFADNGKIRQKSARKIQAAFSLKPDGIVGPLTLGALNVSDCRTTLDRMKACRIRYYNWLIDSGMRHKLNIVLCTLYFRRLRASERVPLFLSCNYIHLLQFFICLCLVL